MPAPAPPEYKELLSMVKLLPDYLVLVDADHRYSWTNRIDSRLSWQQVKEKTVEEFIDEDSRGQAFSIIEKCLHENKPGHFSSTAIIDGSVAGHFTCQVVPAPADNDGRPQALLITRDITDSINAEKKQKESEDRFRNLVEISPDWITVINRNREIVYINHAPAEETGLTKEDILGLPIETTLAEHDREAGLQLVKQVQQTHKPAEYTSGTPDGDKHYTVKLIPVNDEEILLITADISRQVIEARQKETMLAELDHRVKNVLGTVLAIAEQTGHKENNLESFLSTFTGRIRAMALTHEILAATSWHGVSAHDLVRQIVFPLTGEFSLEQPDGQAPLLPSEQVSKLGLVFHELATNAVKYGAASSPGGRFDVEIRHSPGSLNIDWFESFDRPSAAGGRVSSELGLKLVRGLIEYDMGGQLKTCLEEKSIRHSISIQTAQV